MGVGRGAKGPRLLRDRPTGWAVWVAKICAGQGGGIVCKVMEKLWRSCGGGSARQRVTICSWSVTRVSLSDWLAFQARIRGFENPRLLRDRPTDGAAFCAKIYAGMGRIVCAGSVAVCADL